MSVPGRSRIGALTDTHTVLVLPGYEDSDEPHWQTRWEALNPAFTRVQMPDWMHPDRDAWCRTLDAAVAACAPTRPVLFAAHSLGCLTVVFWAAQYASDAQRARVAGALLVALPDPDGGAFPADASGFEPVPMSRLPFASIVVGSTNDAYGGVAFSERCADAWGSRRVDVGARGHINGESGLADWEEGQSLLVSLAQARGA
ncbi:alpha/beta hydrolase [Paraburkholderia sp.]|uniref:RBBP9/YdeN family alpha/beta hydrolase n=1 Tax=Paraburkholderia sp. TaxID=1926495 RepID=UPI0023A38F16|nr:alpha/beta hydrolase [Paraburkholderia sp.]MDE1183761.1 alpha/beta hydrolase [Paraburkholderia sp.]